RETVQRQMRRLELERPRDIGGPRALDTLRQREDQIERDVLDPTCARDIDRATDRRNVVRAVHPLEYTLIERLRAQRETIDACVTPAGDGVRVHVFGIRLESDFRIPDEVQPPSKHRDESSYAFSAKTRRRSTAEIERFDGRVRRFRKTDLQLALHRRDIFVDRHNATHRDREVAVRAAACTEGNVYVDVGRERHYERSSLGNGVTELRNYGN